MTPRLTHTRFAAAMVVVMLMAAMAACSDNALRNAANAIKSVRVANDGMVALVMSEADAGRITIPDARAILLVGDKVYIAVIESAKLTKEYTTFDSSARPKLQQVLRPALTAMTDALDTGLVPIKDANLRSRIRTILLEIQAGLLVANAALEGR